MRYKLKSALSIFFIACAVSCNSKTTDKKPTIEVKKKDILAKSSSLNVVDQNRDLSIIYDTIVFTDNMKGELLNDRFGSSQPELKFYKKFINSKKINKLVVLNKKDVKNEIKYLGEIKDLNNKTSYHVITNFKIIGIGKMLSPRGRSDVAFVKEEENAIIIYNLAMPEYLPKYIANNILFFEYDKTKVGISISGGLPPLFCLPKIGCN
jgi:hypothetical protein